MVCSTRTRGTTNTEPQNKLYDDFFGNSGCFGKFGIFGGLAHLGERLICIQEVAGSIPVSSTRKHLVIKTVNKNNLYQYLYPNIKSYYLMFKIKI